VTSFGRALTVLALALGCTRSPRKQPPPTRNPRPQRTGPSAVSAALPEAPVTANGGGLAPILATRGRGCLDAVEEKLGGDDWYDTAARACHPGSIRSSDVISRQLARAGASVPIPEQLREACWIAFASVEPRALPISVGIVDDEARVQALATLYAARSAIPAFGPLCALGASYDELRFQSAASTKSKLSVVFYSPGSSSR
jgi:hypothetical protein